MTPRILAIDTATEACSVALLDHPHLYHVYEVCPRDHTKRILPMVEQVLSQAEMTLQDVDALAFGRGPGSFTGIRIGIGTAQGLALGANLNMIPVSTLEALAQGAWRTQSAERVIAAIDARMGEIYLGVFERTAEGVWQSVVEECVCSPQQAAEKMMALSGVWVTAGTGWQTYPDFLTNDKISLIKSTILLPDAQDLLPLAALAFKAGLSVPAEAAEPVYLRNEVAWKKLPGR